MASFNQATVIGFVGDEPRVNITQTGRKMATLSIATTEKGYTRKDGTQVQDRTEWHNIVLWGKLAEVAQSYVHKGASLFVQGKMRTRSYDKDGIKRFVTEIEGETLQLLDRRQTGAQGCGYAPQTQNIQQPQVQQQANDDDLPF